MLATALRLRPLITSTVFQSRAGFSSKKSDNKKKSSAPKLQPKKEAEYVSGPKHLRETVLEVRDYQTVSESFNDETALSDIIKEQRENFEVALKRELEEQPDKSTVKAKFIKKIMKV